MTSSCAGCQRIRAVAALSPGGCLPPEAAWWLPPGCAPMLAAVHPGPLTVPAAWLRVNSPEEHLPRPRWRRLFGAAGFTSDGHRATRPAGPLRLFRGAPAIRRYGMAWTVSLEQAMEYAAPYLDDCGQPYRVWTVLAEPWRLLARIHGHEYVTDTRWLRIERLHRGAGRREVA